MTTNECLALAKAAFVTACARSPDLSFASKIDPLVEDLWVNGWLSGVVHGCASQAEEEA